ncbi:DoxX family membrane protein [Vibrio lamellibrachiae]|uniref:hypothetical protein n=1 Tax=Vibrio lamellibrachiae TaxID=2910253 RepID=UPI003D105AFE
MLNTAALSNIMQNTRIVGYFLTAIRCYYGYSWAKAGWGKVTSDFDVVGFFNFFVLQDHSNVVFQAQRGEWGATIWQWFVESVFIPLAPVLNVFIPWAELILGVILILGLFRVWACVFAIFLNLTFIMSGIVWPGVHFVFFQTLIAASRNKHEICVDNALVARKTLSQSTQN